MQSCKNVMKHVVGFICHFGCEPPDNDDNDCTKPEKPKCYQPPERSLSELNAKYKRIKIYDGSKDKDGNAIRKKKYKISKQGNIIKKKKNYCSGEEEDTEIDECNADNDSCEEEPECCKSTQTDMNENCESKMATKVHCVIENEREKICDEGVQTFGEKKVKSCCNSCFGGDQNDENCNDPDNIIKGEKCVPTNDEAEEEEEEEEELGKCDTESDDDDNEDIGDEDQETDACSKNCTKRTAKKRTSNTAGCGPPRKKLKIKKSCPCARLDKHLLRVVMTVREKVLKDQLKTVEQRARKLWQLYSNKMPLCNCCNFRNSKWCKLLAYQKFPFYWAVLVGDFLCPTPFENFLRFYLEENNLESCVLEDCSFKNSMEEMWKGLCKATKMPFITEAFLHSVSEGKVNLRNDCEIRDEFNRLYRISC